jgi:hypothetical protein
MNAVSDVTMSINDYTVWSSTPVDQWQEIPGPMEICAVIKTLVQMTNGANSRTPYCYTNYAPIW